MNFSSDEPNTDLIIWGLNDDGQLGIGKTHVREAITIPKVCKFRVSIKDVDCGENHTQFLTFDYQVYSMGCNIFGQLGQGDLDMTRKCSPHLIENLSDKKIESISSGANYSLALSKYGKVYSWGEGTYGQLGLGKFVNETRPTEMLLPTVLGSSNPKIRFINAGYKHCGLVTEDGQLLLCGANKEGQLGIGNNLSSNKLILNNYIVDKIELVACGMYHTLVLTNISKLFGFGTNEKGQLGCSSRPSSNIPIPIVGFRSENCIVQLGASNFSGFLDDMGKLYLWGFDKEGGAIDPIKQEQDVSIKNFCSWRDTCSIVDERGRVLTLDEQKYLKSKGESECTFSVMVDNGRRISKGACGNGFYVCIPEVRYTRQPSTPHIETKWEGRERKKNDYSTSIKKYGKNYSPSSSKEIMENINNEELKISNRKKQVSYPSNKKENMITGYSDYKNNINYQDSKLLIEDLDVSSKPYREKTPNYEKDNSQRSFQHLKPDLKSAYLTEKEESFQETSKSPRYEGRYTSTKYKYQNPDASLTFQSRNNTKNTDLSYSASQRYQNSTYRSKYEATKRRESGVAYQEEKRRETSQKSNQNKENEDIKRFNHNVEKNRINTSKSYQPIQDTDYDSKQYLTEQEKQIQRDVENLAINFNRDFGKTYNDSKSETKRANYMELQLKNAKDSELLAYWKDRAIYLQDELDYKNSESKLLQQRISELELKNEQVVQQNLNQDDIRQEIIDVKRNYMEYEKENEIIKSNINLHERDKLAQARKIEALEETVSELHNKNLELSKLLDDKVYDISGQIEKNQQRLIQEARVNNTVNSNAYKVTTTTYTDTRSNKQNKISYSYKKDKQANNKPEMDFYKKIEMFEQRDAQRKYDRELTPPIGAIVNSDDQINKTDASDYDSRKLKLAKSATKQMKILDIDQKRNNYSGNNSDNKCTKSSNITKSQSRSNPKEQSNKRPSNAIRKKIIDDSCYFEPVRRPISSQKHLHEDNNITLKSRNQNNEPKRMFFDQKNDLQAAYDYSSKYKQTCPNEEPHPRYSQLQRNDSDLSNNDLPNRDNNRYSMIEKRARSVREKKGQQEKRLKEYENKFSGYNF